MNLREARTGEMIQFCREWQQHADAFRRYPLTAPFIEAVADVGGDLERAEATLKGLDKGKRAQIEEKMREADGRHDFAARKLYGGVEWLALGSKNAPVYERFLDTVFADGMAVVNTSVRNQAGIAAMLPARIAKQPLLQAVLDTELDGTKLGVYFEQMLQAGLEAGELAAQLQVTEDVGQQTVTEYRARQRWITMVGLLRRMIEFAEWTPEDAELVLGPLEGQLAGR
jgi:hypothetical protein